MAKSASVENVQADMQPPNYRAAVQKVRTLQAKKDKIGSLNGEIGQIWAQTEGHRCNKKGAKIFYTLDRMEASERNDVLRTLEGMLAAAGYDEEAREDMLDKIPKGSVLPMRRTMTAEEGQAEIEDAGGTYPGDNDEPYVTEDDVALAENAIAAAGGIDVSVHADTVGTDGPSVEDVLARSEASELAENGEVAPSANPDSFVEASEEELKAQAGRGAKGGGRKGNAAKSDGNNVHPLRA